MNNAVFVHGIHSYMAFTFKKRGIMRKGGGRRNKTQILFRDRKTESTPTQKQFFMRKREVPFLASILHNVIYIVGWPLGSVLPGNGLNLTNSEGFKWNGEPDFRISRLRKATKIPRFLSRQHLS
jgi:hypothetical protein